jgi:hypothetical protein|tara:strand:- start:3019 stop:5568 length:2550 start_codon:yes stop_codon:yes gene_type:complete
MARIYKPDQYDSVFRPQIQSQGFAREEAYDPSKQIQQDYQRRVQDVKNVARSASRQAGLDQQRIQVASAEANATFATLKGVLSLTQAGLKLYGARQDVLEEQRKDDDILKAAGFGFDDDGTISTPEAPATPVQISDQKSQFSQDLHNVTEEEVATLQDGTIEGSALASALRFEKANAVISGGYNGSLVDARTLNKPFLDQAIAEIPDNQLPTTYGQAVAMSKDLQRQYIRGMGFRDVPQDQLANELAPTMVENARQAAVSLLQRGVKIQQANNMAAIRSQLYRDSKDPSYTPQSLWNAYSNKMAFGEVGYTGMTAASNEATVKLFVELFKDDPDQLQALVGVQKRDGVKGTELGFEYGYIIEPAIKKARQARAAEYDLNIREMNNRAKDAFAQWRVDGDRAKFLSVVGSIPTEYAMGLRDKIAARPLNESTAALNELERIRKENGGFIPMPILNSYRDNLMISEKTFNNYAQGNVDHRNRKPAADFVTSKQDDIRQRIKETNTVSAANMPAYMIRDRALALGEILQERLMAEARINPDILREDKGSERNQFYVEQMKQLTQDPRFMLGSDAKTPVFQAPLVPTLSQTEQSVIQSRSTGEVQDFVGLKPKQVFDRYRNYADISEDFFVSKDDLTTASDYFRNDGKAGSLPQSVTEAAQAAGVSEKAFVAAQRTARGLPPLNRPTYQPSAQQVSARNGRVVNTAERNIPGEAEGFALLRQSLPLRGAAYLASAITHESGWDGGDWGEVMGDGTSANGGLVSWAAWHNNPARLGKVMKHFGVSSMALVPEEDQLQYMLDEMKQHYRFSYDVLTDANAHPSDLEAAIHAYFGFDKRYTGNRFTHARTLISQNN